MERMTEPVIDWEATFFAQRRGGVGDIVFCTSFKQGGVLWGDVCARCGVEEPEHYSEDDRPKPIDLQEHRDRR